MQIEVVVYIVEEDGDEPYYIAYLPCYGEAACSAPGETVEEALDLLQKIMAEVEEYNANKSRKDKRNQT